MLLVAVAVRVGEFVEVVLVRPAVDSCTGCREVGSNFRIIECYPVIYVSSGCQRTYSVSKSMSKYLARLSPCGPFARLDPIFSH